MREVTTPVALVIMDGFGLGAPGPGNAITEANTPNLDRLFAECPWAPLEASGEAVGLPDGQMGNSEVGHLNIGAGRVVYQELTRICKSIEDGSLVENEVLATAMDAAIAANGAVHFMGLLSDGGVHSHQDHLYALVRMAASRGAKRVFVHAFLDGRDVPPHSGLGFIEKLEVVLAEVGVGRIATVMGRYYAMDRDKRWERVEQAWSAMTLGIGVHTPSATAALSASYEAGVTDEFVAPTVVCDGDLPIGTLADHDALVFFNFRPDRAREITRAFVDPAFDGFVRSVQPKLHFVCLTDYDPTIPAPVAFAKDLPCCVLADVLSEAGLRQLHIAETEKYAHVTFFLNGGAEAPKDGEERVLVPSPHVPTYDSQPEMSEPEVTRLLVEAIEQQRADFYVVNYANCDMVGHTGVSEAAIRAVEAVDDGVGRVARAISALGGALIVTADHGNAERMMEPDGSPFTAHTTDPVPFICCGGGVTQVRDGGILADVAPSVLDLLGIDPPAEWTGETLLGR
ncbi:MAG: 2,3-bisphosphoglycerate-independent phosphoglycerate mutase [Actinobacteria bacterium HGW-Actinobacteria-1]|jgi:2,3-bisphosphoglycerate-independent phosphoglycerate mutase|nr:MAG: 2,3-bisphosphoglycerate-independent phosphoglycerate mutase [Actinobacteria bacterium HGW-Actinobacteria-1]